MSVSEAAAAAAAAAMLKVFHIVAAAALTHPLPDDEDWRVLGVGKGQAHDEEPLAVFVGVLLADSGAAGARALQQTAASRFGTQVNAKIDADNAWWSSAPLLMQARGEANSAVSKGASRSTAAHAALDSAAPRHRYVCRNAHVTCACPRFVWPSHHYSAILATWGSSGMQARDLLQVQF